MDFVSELKVEDRSFVGSLKRAHEIRGENPALAFTNGGSYTAKELMLGSARLAHVFAQKGTKPGDRIAIIAGNSVEYLWAMFGASWIGACPAGLNVHLRGGTMEHQINNLDPTIIVCENATLEAVEAVLGNDPRIMNIDTDPAFEALRTGGHNLPTAPIYNSKPDDLAMITYTSGTTGLSKGTMYGQEMAIYFCDSSDWMFGYTADDISYSCLPFFHANAIMCSLIPAMRKGAMSVFSPRFSASQFWGEVKKYQATVTSLLGSMVPILMSAPPTDSDADNTLRIAQAVPASKENFYDFQNRFGIKLFSMYGLSDIGVLVGVPHDIEGRPGKAGIAHPDWEHLIVDDHGNPVADGEIGELLIRPKKMNILQLGYWRNPEATVKAWKDLWFHTGDYLRRDTDGWFEFIDRKKDAMRRFGENISSYEVELALHKHPAIEEAAVYAVPAEMSEDEVMACIILKPGHSDMQQDILQHCETELPYFAVPRYYRFVTEMERTPTNKIRKDLLRNTGVNEETWDAGPRGRKKRASS